jgi:hypothetical protein
MMITKQKRRVMPAAQLTTRQEVERAEGEGLPPLPEALAPTPRTTVIGFGLAEFCTNGVGDVNME